MRTTYIGLYNCARDSKTRSEDAVFGHPAFASQLPKKASAWWHRRSRRLGIGPYRIRLRPYFVRHIRHTGVPYPYPYRDAGGSYDTSTNSSTSSAIFLGTSPAGEDCARRGLVSKILGDTATAPPYANWPELQLSQLYFTAPLLGPQRTPYVRKSGRIRPYLYGLYGVPTAYGRTVPDAPECHTIRYGSRTIRTVHPYCTVRRRSLTKTWTHAADWSRCATAASELRVDIGNARHPARSMPAQGAFGSASRNTGS
ncbi:hypothetical protein GGX14DRAFT_407440 [Mycena pura]|uniref:Uncharacterized protein n=1 Tax=Mycena pura TaxID=153505 RepID=A0AAD6US54_9AGAR|nr:hypothetical protein GGX14DRAFT_407440 [Mycena pura]